jgi:hypothetical protein
MQTNAGQDSVSAFQMKADPDPGIQAKFFPNVTEHYFFSISYQYFSNHSKVLLTVFIICYSYLSSDFYLPLIWADFTHFSIKIRICIADLDPEA